MTSNKTATPNGETPRRFLLWLACVVFAGWFLGELARDRYLVSQMFFYLPSPIVSAALFAAAGLLVLLGRRSAFLVLVMALIPLATTLLLENRWSVATEHARGHDVHRLVHWNVNGYYSLRTEHLGQLVDAKADVYLFSEAGRSHLTESLTETLGDEWNGQSIEPMFVVDPETVWGEEALVYNHWMRVRLARWKTTDGTLLLMLVDLISDPHIHRDPLLQAINLLIDKYQPDIVIGDFNAPRRSRALTELPGGYRHAYDAAGAGWSYSYTPLSFGPPVLAIDQCIVGPRIEPIDYRLPAFIGSDHRPQILDFRIKRDRDSTSG